MVNYERKNISKEMTELNIEGHTLPQALEYIESLIRRYGEKAYIEQIEHGYGDDITTSLSVMVEVEETDNQMKARITREEKLEEYTREADLKKYEELKKKFGD